MHKAVNRTTNGIIHRAIQGCTFSDHCCRAHRADQELLIGKGQCGQESRYSDREPLQCTEMGSEMRVTETGSQNEV